MTVSDVKRLTDDALRRDLRTLVAHDRTTTVRLLIHMAEFDSRRLYRADGYPSMHAYCVGELKMSDDVANKRIRSARKARVHPKILLGLADGSLTLTAVAMLSRHLTDETAPDLLAAAAGRTIAQIGELIAERFPQPDLATLVRPLPERQRLTAVVSPAEPPICQELAARPVETHVVFASPPPAKVTPLAPERYGVQFTIGREDRELLEQAKALLSHQIPSRDEAQVFVHALRALVRQLEKRKFGATDKPRKSARESKNPRHISARLRRAVHERDGGRCTFVAENGHRCEARGFLEFDHVLEVARGGQSTMANVRLRCRAHNQYTAEQTYGAELMKAKREEAAKTRTEAPRDVQLSRAAPAR